jgi:predicted phosphodiesterase
VKLAIVSDIHANLEALEAVLEDIRQQGIGEIYCLGDIVGYGPNPRECLEHAMSWSLCLLGEADQLVREAPDGGTKLLPGPRFAPSGKPAWAAWTKQQLRVGSPADGERRIRFLLGSEPTATREDLLLVHGSPRNPLREYLFPEDVYNERMIVNNFRDVEGHCFCGRTHIAGVIRERCDFLSPEDCAGGYLLSTEKTIVNVGSVGQPRDGDPRACYVVLDGRRIEFRRIEYPYEITMRKLEQLL